MHPIRIEKEADNKTPDFSIVSLIIRLIVMTQITVLQHFNH